MTDTEWGATARGDGGRGVGPWLDLGQYPAFQLLGDVTLPWSDGFESGDTTAWSATVP